MKTKDSLLKTEDVLLKTRNGPSVNRKLVTHILTNIPIHPHTLTFDLEDCNRLSLWLSLTNTFVIAAPLIEREPAGNHNWYPYRENPIISTFTI